MNKKPILVCFGALLLSACGGNPVESSSLTSVTSDATRDTSTISSEPISNKVRFYDGDQLLYTLDKKDGYVSDPGTPLKKNYVFDGWKDKEGNDFSFEMKAPDELFTKWVIYQNLTDEQKLEKYINRVVEYCPLVYQTRGHIETAYQYSFMEGVYTSLDVFTATRYDNFIVITDHYFPKVCYVNDDLSEEEQRLGLTIDEVNAKNKTLTVQETYSNGRLTSIYDYNEMHEAYDAGNEDGKEIVSVSDDQIDTTLKIDFASFFMGWANQLLLLMKRGWDFDALDEFDEETELTSDFYYIRPLNVSILDNHEVGASFSFAYGFTYEGTSGNYVTNMYSSEGSFAFIDGKIRHCQVEKYHINYVDGEPISSERSISIFDFDTASDYPKFEGELLDPKNYDIYEE